MSKNFHFFALVSINQGDIFQIISLKRGRQYQKQRCLKRLCDFHSKMSRSSTQNEKFNVGISKKIAKPLKAPLSADMIN